MNGTIPTTNRRNVLKALGGGAATLGVGGAGVLAMTGSGAAQMSSTFTAEAVELSSDGGDVGELFLAPRSAVEWANFDVPVTKIRQTVFARALRDGDPLTPTPESNNPVPEQSGWWPIYRNTPWLFTTVENEADADFQYGDSYAAYSADQPWPLHALEYGGADGQKQNGTTGLLDYEMNNGEPVYVAQEGSPLPTDYSESTLTGTSIGTAAERVNGAYGTIGDTTEFDNPDDGSDKVTTVELGLLTTAHTDYDFAQNVTAPDAENPDRLSPLVMGNADDVDYAFGEDTHAIPYAELVGNADSHPAVEWITTDYTVTATNEGSTNGSNTTANTGGS